MCQNVWIEMVLQKEFDTFQNLMDSDIVVLTIQDTGKAGKKF